jgi:hypothetical protein
VAKIVTVEEIPKVVAKLLKETEHLEHLLEDLGTVICDWTGCILGTVDVKGLDDLPPNIAVHGDIGAFEDFWAEFDPDGELDMPVNEGRALLEEINA